MTRAAVMIKANHLKPFSILGQQQGIALLVVLWVMTMLTVIVGQFCYSMRSEINMTRNFRDSTKAYYQARAGIQQALFQLLKTGKQEAVGSELDSPLAWRVNVENPQVMLGDGSFTVRVGNVSGLININLADSSLLELMFIGLELDDTEQKIIVDSIQDWRDADDFHRLNGAENDYYQRLPEPYSSQNGPFRSIEDLLLVRGMTREILAAIRDRITIYPKASSEKPKKKNSKGKKEKSDFMEQKQININAAPPEVLAILPFMTDTAIRDITEFRRVADFRSLSEVKEIIGGDIYQQSAQYMTLEYSSYYTLLSTGKVSDSEAVQTVYAVVDIDADQEKYQYVKWLDSDNGL